MAAVSGSLFRRILFWTHLGSGVAAGLLILLMSVTGVLLTYEHQMVASAEKRNHAAASAGSQRLAIDELASAARAAAGDAPRVSLIISAQATAPVAVSTGRETAALLNPFTGAAVVDASAASRSFFRTIEDWHRWMGGDPHSTRANLLDYANLLFLFIIASGLYLWLPAVWRWRTLRGLMLFQRRYINAKVRDFNWHHVFGVWMLVPLFVIALSGVVMSFAWANNAVYAAFGEQPAAARWAAGRTPGGRRSWPGATSAPRHARCRTTHARQPAAAVRRRHPGARLATSHDTGGRAGPLVDIVIELQSTESRPPRRTLTLNTSDASLVRLTRHAPRHRARPHRVQGSAPAPGSVLHIPASNTAHRPDHCRRRFAGGLLSGLHRPGAGLAAPDSPGVSAPFRSPVATRDCVKSAGRRTAPRRPAARVADPADPPSR